MTLQFSATNPEHPALLLELPWHLPLEEWPQKRLVTLPRGISRHVVRYARAGAEVVAVKELAERPAVREYELLRTLARFGIPAVDPLAVVTGRTDIGGEPLESVLITRHLNGSLPYRSMFETTMRPTTVHRLMDALAVLLVRLHLAGFAWGDCSLSNALFRRDAGAYAAYLVDAETGEVHDRLSTGQRAYDIDLARVNISGEMLDLEAAGALHPSVDPIAFGAEICRRYDELWNELTRTSVYPAGKPSTLDPYLGYLRQRWDEGQHSAKILHKELQVKGYLGHYQRVKMAVAPLRRGLPIDEPRERPPSSTSGFPGSSTTAPNSSSPTTWSAASPPCSTTATRHPCQRGWAISKGAVWHHSSAWPGAFHEDRQAVAQGITTSYTPGWPGACSRSSNPPRWSSMTPGSSRTGTRRRA